MSETDPGPLPTSKMDFPVIKLMAPPYMPSLRIVQETPRSIIYYSHCCYSVKSSALSIILFSLLYLFAPKPGKICTHNSIDNFLITSSSVVCSEFNHIPFSIMGRVKQIIFNYFKFF